MPKVVDAARVTAPNNTVWRTCTGCDQLAPLPAGIELCQICLRPKPENPTRAEIRAAVNQDVLDRYATLVGRIEAWAELIPNISDAERLEKICDALKNLHPHRKNAEVK